jgi:hypothetical protein
MQTKQITLHVEDCNGRARGSMTVELETLGGELMTVTHDGVRYVTTGRTGLNFKFQKQVERCDADGDAKRIWIASDLTFISED